MSEHYSINNKPTNILSAWVAMEVLSPPSFRKPEDIAGGDCSRIARFDEVQSPWENGGEKSRDKCRLYYQIILGSVDLAKAESALLRVYSGTRAELPPASGEAVLATITVDQNGCPSEGDTVAISSFGWGLAEALKGKLDDLGKWTEIESLLVEKLKSKIEKSDKEGNPVPLNHEIIQDAYDWLLQKINLSTKFTKPPFFAVRVYQPVKLEEPPEAIILNSFYLQDLEQAKKKFLSGQATPNLKLYLGAIHVQDRQNLLQDNEVISQALEPQKFPLGSWPGNGRFPLALLQQCAVNLALEDLQKDGIIAVNGPPGTGKTTLLRDIIAALVTKRAQILCSYDDPEKAFINSKKILKKEHSTISLYHLDPKIKGYEMVVASSNNKAVENVSAELPAKQGVAEDAEGLCYFKTVSDALLKRETWGAIAAVLGNGKNRSEFRQTFWWDNDVGLQKYLQHASGNHQFIKEEPLSEIKQKKPRIIINENAPENHEEALERWKTARQKFKQCINTAQIALKDLQKIFELLQPIGQKQKIAKEIGGEIDVLQSHLAEQMKSLEKAVSERERKQHKVEKLRQRHDVLWTRRPGFFPRLFRTETYRLWRNKYIPQWTELINEEDVLARLEDDVEVQERKCEEIKADIQKKQIPFDEVNREIALPQNDCQKLHHKHPGIVISDEFFHLSHEQKQKSAPWLDEATARLRNDVFEAAMAVHKAFIDCAAKPIRNNLNALMDNFGTKSLGGEKEDTLIADIWSTLFLLVPVVSTTFASISRMFNKIDTEAFGWLLIDEAGQALPQAAVGALMRTRRAIVVGDPMQIEPVVVLPERLTQAICKQFGVDPLLYNAPEASVQTLADSATKYYATFETRYGIRDVGVPLLVHRRCADPMFSISNEIAYENMMVQAKTSKSSPIRDILGSSRWFDIAGQAPEKWCPEEGEKLLSLLQCLKDQNCAPDFYIVTPFVVVQNQVRQILRNSKLLDGWVKDPRTWVSEHVGTVHTVQGREAEAVFFILGAPDFKQRGARDWAGKSPNLLNVAATRAKEVFYVIGNRKLWKTAGVFQSLEKMLTKIE